MGSFTDLGSAGDLIGAAAGMWDNRFSNLANAFNSQIAGMQSRAFTREMYEKSLNDNIMLWEMNNAYNTPAAQKQRLIDAGLNPALMYGGKSGGGVASSTPSTGNISQTVPPAAQISAGLNLLDQVYDLKMKRTKALKDEMDWNAISSIGLSEIMGGKRSEINFKIHQANREGLKYRSESRYYDRQQKAKTLREESDARIRALEEKIYGLMRFGNLFKSFIPGGFTPPR